MKDRKKKQEKTKSREEETSVEETMEEETMRTKMAVAAMEEEEEAEIFAKVKEVETSKIAKEMK